MVMGNAILKHAVAGCFVLACLTCLVGCVASQGKESASVTTNDTIIAVTDKPAPIPASISETLDAETLRAKLHITEDYRESFVHGEKTAGFQRYIVLHDTEGESNGESVVQYWDDNGAGVAAHFIVNKDGSIVQCVPLDAIAHHAGYGDTGHNEAFAIAEDGRDDMVGTVPIGDWASDYGMNAWSIGIEMVHVGGEGDYPIEQLEAVDALIAYIDAYYGFESAIIDHKEWRSGNSDTSPEFEEYLANYKEFRSYRTP